MAQIVVFVFSVTLTLTLDLCSIVCHTHCAWYTGISMRSFIRIRPVILGDMPWTHTHTHTYTHTHTEGHSNSLTKCSTNKLGYIELYISKTRIYRSFSEVPLPFKSMLITFHISNSSKSLESSQFRDQHTNRNQLTLLSFLTHICHSYIEHF